MPVLAPPSPPHGRALFNFLKKAWYTEEERARRGLHTPKSMTTAPESWQKWLVHPQGVPVVDDRSLSLVEGFAKIDSLELSKVLLGTGDLLKAVRFTPAVIVSDHLVLPDQLAWVCRIHNGARRVPSDVPIAGGRVCQTHWLRVVNSDLTIPVEDRELLTFQGMLDVGDRRQITDTLTSLINGTWADPDAPPAGTIVRCSLEDLQFDAFVVSSCNVWTDVRHRSNPVIVCRIFDHDSGDDPTEDDDGVIVLPSDGSCAYPDLPAEIDAMYIMGVPKGYVLQVGNAHAYLPKVRRMILGFLAAP